MPFLAHKFLALVRLSNLGIRLKTGRYERPRLKEHLLLCPPCLDRVSVENENHVLFSVESMKNCAEHGYRKLCEKFKIVLNESSNVKATAQFVIDLYDKRSKIVNK